MAKKKIIAVDDNESIRFLLKTLLELQGYDVTLCESGAQALEAIDKIKPHLILLDLMMPKMDGWEVCKRIREEKKLKTPIIIITARADDLSKKLSENVYKVAGYLTKPFLREDVITAVDKAIGK